MQFINIQPTSSRRLLVRMEGLEPPCFAALDPKSSASTNSATSALLLYKSTTNKRFFMLMKQKNIQ